MDIFELIRKKLEEHSSKAEQDMNYYKDLAEQDSSYEVFEDIHKTEYEAYQEAISIVDLTEEEYNNGWIPCKKGLPKSPNTYLVTKMSVCDGNPIYATSHEIFWGSDGKWDCERDEDSEWKVIAWQNKIKPYIPETN